ncbi:GNAT family N-acetyltransferase [uncultured Microbacterium sp.]|nr:GNAT family N-acetyltransferase [uncultured Microbacterium sp.]
MERRLIATAAGEGYPLALVDGTEIIGRFNLAGISRGPFQSAGLGYWVDRNHLGRGLASAAVGAIVAEARDALRLHRIEASTLVHNTASQQPLPGRPARRAPGAAAAHHRGRRNHRGRTVTGASILPA